MKLKTLDVKVVVNLARSRNSTTFEVDSIPYQEIEVHAVFNMNRKPIQLAKGDGEESENDRSNLN